MYLRVLQHQQQEVVHRALLAAEEAAVALALAEEAVAAAEAAPVEVEVAAVEAEAELAVSSIRQTLQFILQADQRRTREP